MGRYPLLSNGISFLLSYVLVFCRGVEVKIEVNKKMWLDLFFSFSGYELTMTRSDFAKCRALHDMDTGWVIAIEDKC